MKNTDKKAIAQLLYSQGWTQALISERLNVSKNTVGKWKTEGKWDELRNALSTTPLQTERNLQRHAFNLSKRDIITREDAMIMNAISTMLEKVEKKALGAADKIAVLQEFTEFVLTKEDLGAAKTLIKYQKEFLTTQLGDGDK